MEGFVFAWLFHLIGLTPLLVLYLVGMGLAIRFWRQYPTSARLTLIAMGILFLSNLVQPLVQMFLLTSRATGGFRISAWTWLLGLVNVTGIFFHAIALGLLLAAIFWRRERPEFERSTLPSREED